MTENIWRILGETADTVSTVYLDAEKIQARLDARGWTPTQVAQKLQAQKPNGKDRLPWLRNVLRGHRNDAGRTPAFVRPELALALISLLRDPSETPAQALRALVLDYQTLTDRHQSGPDFVLALLSERLAARQADPTLPQRRLRRDSPATRTLLLRQEEELIRLVGSLLLLLLGRNEPEGTA